MTFRDDALCILNPRASDALPLGCALWHHNHHSVPHFDTPSQPAGHWRLPRGHALCYSPAGSSSSTSISLHLEHPLCPYHSSAHRLLLHPSVQIPGGWDLGAKCFCGHEREERRQEKTARDKTEAKKAPRQNVNMFQIINKAFLLPNLHLLFVFLTSKWSHVQCVKLLSTNIVS